MVAPIWIQIKKKIRVPTNNEMARYSERSDWKTLTTLTYEDSKMLFSVLGNGPIKTTSQFVFLIRENFGAGEYMCIARSESGARFWLFLKFICDNQHYKIEPTYVSYKRRKGRVISNKECRRLSNKVQQSTSKEEREFYEKELVYEEYKLKQQTETRRGPYPYLIDSPQQGKITEMEDYRVVETQPQLEEEYEDEIIGDGMSVW